VRGCASWQRAQDLAGDALDLCRRRVQQATCDHRGRQGDPLHAALAPRRPDLFASDFRDFSSYVDADEAHIADWFVERFLALRADAVAGGPGAERWAAAGADQAAEQAQQISTTSNGRTLRENIRPARPRVDLSVHKRADHAVDRISLRKL
jgi:hypothetical protein